MSFRLWAAAVAAVAALALMVLAAVWPRVDSNPDEAAAVTVADPEPAPPRTSSRLAKLGLPEDTLVRIAEARTIEDFDRPIAQFETVFWDPEDTVSLRKLLRDTDLVRGKRVMEIGTGTGLIALCALKAGASKVVATDVNPSAIANAAYNAELLGLADRLDLRRVSLDDAGAFAVIQPNERFDLIVTNPPWEDARPNGIAEFALYDEGFALLRSLVAGLTDHLAPGGKALLAYGHVPAIEEILRLAPEHGLSATILDDRDLKSLPKDFLPGMLVELTPK